MVTSPNPFLLNSRLSPFSYLLLIRMLKPERFGEMLDLYIVHSGYGELLQPVDFNLADVFKQMDCVTPALFVMGDDPLNKLTEFLSRRKVMKHTLVISMGEGQGALAEKALEKEIRR